MRVTCINVYQGKKSVGCTAIAMSVASIHKQWIKNNYVFTGTCYLRMDWNPVNASEAFVLLFHSLLFHSNHSSISTISTGNASFHCRTRRKHFRKSNCRRCRMGLEAGNRRRGMHKRTCLTRFLSPKIVMHVCLTAFDHPMANELVQVYRWHPCYIPWHWQLAKCSSNHLSHGIWPEPIKRGLQTQATREESDVAVREHQLNARKQHLAELRMKTQTANEERAQAENALAMAQKTEATAREKTQAALEAKKTASVRRFCCAYWKLWAQEVAHNRDSYCFSQNAHLQRHTYI